MRASTYVLRLALWLVLLVWSVELWFVVLMRVGPPRLPFPPFSALASLILVLMFSGYARDAVWPGQPGERSLLCSGVRFGTLAAIPFFLLTFVSGLMAFVVAFWSARAFVAGFLAGVIWHLAGCARKQWRARHAGSPAA